jgi:hypothetical protein
MWRLGPGVEGVAYTWLLDEAPFPVEAVMDMEKKEWFLNCPTLGINMEPVEGTEGYPSIHSMGIENILDHAQTQMMRVFTNMYHDMHKAISGVAYRPKEPDPPQRLKGKPRGKKGKSKGEEPGPFLL